MNGAAGNVGTAPVPQAGSFAAVREYCIKAAAYDAAFNRRADNLARRERIARSVVVVITAVTSLSAFGAIFVDNPSLWAKLLVFALAAVTSALTALRHSENWMRESDRLRLDGFRWAEQHNKARNLAARLCDRGVVTPQDVATLSEADAKLVRSNHALPNRLYDHFRGRATTEFDSRYRLGGDTG
jgi:uncharacterized protein (DUF983 family)